MKIIAKIIPLIGLSLLFVKAPLLAGEAKSFKEKVVIEEPVKWLGVTLSTGWDSLYMFRGVNVISHGAYGNTDDYGSGIYWTNPAFTWNISPNDILTVGGWLAFGTSNTTYKELDVNLCYTHTIGNLALSAGYSFYYIFPASSANLYSNEPNVSAAYTFRAGSATITPSIGYYFNVGPDIAGGHGIAKAAASYLYLRVDSNIPIYKDVVSLTPWISYGTNFRYNPRLTQDGTYDFYNGANNIEMGLAIPVKINDWISVSGYGAYGYAFSNLWGTTSPSTFWGGTKVTFAF